MNSVARSLLLGITFGTASVHILLSFGMDQACLTCHLAGAFSGPLDIRRILGELYRLRSWGALAGSPRGCLSIHLEVCLPSLHLTRLTYRRSGVTWLNIRDCTILKLGLFEIPVRSSPSLESHSSASD